MALVKLCLLGEQGSGKSSLAIQICHDRFEDGYDPYIADSYCKLIEIDGANLMLDVGDTAARDPSIAFLTNEQWIRGNEGFAIIYSITARSSFEQVSQHADQVIRIKGAEPVPLTIVGNKVDLKDERKVSTHEGQELALEFGAQFLETPAKTRTNVEKLFFELARSVRKIQEQRKKAKKRSCVLL